MRCIKDVGAVKKFRRKAWGFQETFETPLKELDGFVGSIVAAIGEVTRVRRCVPRRGRVGDRLDQSRCEPVVEFASMRRAHWSQSRSLPVPCSSHSQVPASRSFGAIRSDKAAEDPQSAVTAVRGSRVNFSRTAI